MYTVQGRHVQDQCRDWVTLILYLACNAVSGACKDDVMPACHLPGDNKAPLNHLSGFMAELTRMWKRSCTNWEQDDDRRPGVQRGRCRQ